MHANSTVLNATQGLFFIAIQQLLLGVSLYSIIHYLHPSLIKLCWLLFGVNAISAVLGFFGALKRNMVIECVYLVFYFLSLFLIFLTVLDMAELVHLLPKSPQLHDVSNFAAMPASGMLRGDFKSHVFLRQRELPLGLGQDTLLPPNYDADEEAEIERDLKSANSADSTDVEDTLPSELPVPDKQARQTPVKQLDQSDADQQMQNTTPTPSSTAVEHKVKPQSVDEGTMDNVTESTANVPTGVSQNNREAAPQHAAPLPSGETSVNTAVPVEKVAAKAETATTVEASKSDGVAEEKTESLYDQIPLLPHLGETEGEAEEVAKEELPPETRDLTPEGRSEVVVLYKIQKRPLKMAAAGLLTVALLFNMYCYWVAVTFVLNKCTCLDELVSHPEQFTPLID
ncbi:uncharacterized protein BcabD6B2_56930 [Babesia caballi]|uniref:Transmembrane protein, putative n=1 Tax=Babesia caballi TaxID=5871 RepID=A0AAV4M2F6_BABCB|nr:transmembrane protein, putative [Babesia caballi]